MKVFNRISSLCHTFSFWGIVFLACFVGVLNVKFQDIFTIALNGPIELQIICIYMLLSIPVFILLVVMHYVKNMIPAIEVFIINFQTTICTPYKGFDFSECFKFKKLGMDRSMIISDLKVLFRRFFQTIIWWTIVGFSIYNIINIPANPIKTAIEAIPTSEFYIRIASIVGIIVLLNIIAWVMFKIMTKRWRNEDIRAEKKNICKKTIVINTMTEISIGSLPVVVHAVVHILIAEQVVIFLMTKATRSRTGFILLRSTERATNPLL